jgi:hypothetical protein
MAKSIAFKWLRRWLRAMLGPRRSVGLRGQQLVRQCPAQYQLTSFKRTHTVATLDDVRPPRATITATSGGHPLLRGGSDVALALETADI